jgi:hypothetical protein
VRVLIDPEGLASMADSLTTSAVNYQDLIYDVGSCGEEQLPADLAYQLADVAGATRSELTWLADECNYAAGDLTARVECAVGEVPLWDAACNILGTTCTASVDTSASTSWGEPLAPGYVDAVTGANVVWSASGWDASDDQSAWREQYASLFDEPEPIAWNTDDTTFDTYGYDGLLTGSGDGGWTDPGYADPSGGETYGYEGLLTGGDLGYGDATAGFPGVSIGDAGVLVSAGSVGSIFDPGYGNILLPSDIATFGGDVPFGGDPTLTSLSNLGSILGSVGSDQPLFMAGDPYSSFFGDL